MQPISDNGVLALTAFILISEHPIVFALLMLLINSAFIYFMGAYQTLMCYSIAVIIIFIVYIAYPETKVDTVEVDLKEN
jgi:hypothetical protein